MSFYKLCQSWAFFAFNIWFCSLSHIFSKILHFQRMGKWKFVSSVIQSFTKKLSISSQGKSAKTWLFDPLENICVYLMDFWRIQLINFYTVWSCCSYLFIRRGGPWTKNKRSLRLLTCFCCCNFTIWCCHSLERCGCHTNWWSNFRPQYCSLSAFPLTVINKCCLL